jgi:predicted RNA binding protein YcfA (HicA-like mRNA interferase family)
VVPLFVPPKIRQLVKQLKQSGFVSRGGKGSHRVFRHPLGLFVVLSGKAGADAKDYQIKQVRSSIESVQNEKK